MPKLDLIDINKVIGPNVHKEKKNGYMLKMIKLQRVHCMSKMKNDQTMSEIGLDMS